MLVLHPLTSLVLLAVWLVSRARSTGKASVASLLIIARTADRDRRSPGAPAWEIVYVIALVRAGAGPPHRQHQAADRSTRAVGQQPMSAVAAATAALLDTADARRFEAPNRVMFGPHVTNLGDDDRRFTPRHIGVLRDGAPPAAAASSSPRAPACTTATGRTSGRRWPSRCAAGWQAIADACHAARTPGDRLARPRRRPGQQRVQPAAAVGAVAGARGQQPRDAEVDGGRRHRRR